MTIEINDLALPKEELENECQVAQVSLRQKDGGALGWTYEYVLLELRFEKISVKVKSEASVIMKGTLGEKGMAIVRFDNLMITPWGRADG